LAEKGAEDVREPWILIGCGDEAVHGSVHRRRVLTFQRLELVLETAACRQADDRRQVEMP
jgi:hypothetical protein